MFQKFKLTSVLYDLKSSIVSKVSAVLNEFNDLIIVLTLAN